MDNLTLTVRGLTIGSGTSYPLAPQGFPAIWDTPDIRVNDVGRPRADGIIPNSDHLGGRSFASVVRLYGSLATIEAAITALATAFSPEDDQETLNVRFSGTPAEYAFFGRCRGIQVAWRTKALATSIVDVRCNFTATDPIRYGAEANEVIGLATNHLPQTVPFVVGYNDSETANNTGLVATDRWTADLEAISGDWVNPSLTNVTTGNQIIFFGITIPSGETLVIDGRARRAVLEGTTVVVPTVAQWWKLAPGNNTIRAAGANSSSLSSTATLTWRPGWV